MASERIRIAHRLMDPEDGKDYDRVHAWIQNEANEGRIRVYRVSNFKREGLQHFHYVEFLNDEGEVLEESVGYVTGLDVHLGKWHVKYVKWSELWDDRHTKIRLMISDSLPDFPIFKNVNLGFNDDDHFRFFEIILHNDAIYDEFE